MDKANFFFTFKDIYENFNESLKLMEKITHILIMRWNKVWQIR
jgi:hypothetical protein